MAWRPCRPASEIVAIQDAARPCTSQALIAATVAAARETGAAVAAQAVTDTIKESRDGKLIERTLDRSQLWAVQTPADVSRGDHPPRLGGRCGSGACWSPTTPPRAN